MNAAASGLFRVFGAGGTKETGCCQRDLFISTAQILLLVLSVGPSVRRWASDHDRGDWKTVGENNINPHGLRTQEEPFRDQGRESERKRLSQPLQRRQWSFVPNPTTTPRGDPSDSLAEGLEGFQLQRHPRVTSCNDRKQCSQRGAVEKTKIHAPAETPRTRGGAAEAIMGGECVVEENKITLTDRG